VSDITHFHHKNNRKITDITSNFYIILSSQNLISIKGSSIIKLSQQEIADIVKLSKVKVNAIIAELKTDGYIFQKSPRGKYSLGDKAREELADIYKSGITE
jgi:biotin operon repressor